MLPNYSPLKLKIMTTTNITNLNSLPANAIIITYSDHYRGNSGDDIYLTDNEGRDTHFNGFANRLQPHTFMDDRGVISAVAITSEKGPFAAFREFKTICSQYVAASSNLKLWDNGETVYNIPGFEEYGNCGAENKKFTGSYDSQPFEASAWYRRCAKRSKAETILLKKVEFEADQKRRNQYVRSILAENKANAAKWFEENGISVRCAYLFTEGYF